MKDVSDKSRKTERNFHLIPLETKRSGQIIIGLRFWKWLLSALNQRKLWILILVVVVSLGGAMYELLRPKQAHMSADVVTEYAAISLPKGQRLPSGLPSEGHVIGAGIPRCHKENQIRWFNGVLQHNVRLTLIAREISDTVTIRMESTDAQAQLGTVNCSGNSTPMQGAVIVASDDKALNIVGYGMLTLGEVPRETGELGSSSILSGTIEVYALSFPMRSGFLLTSRKLMLGDSIRMMADEKGTKDAESAFFIRKNNKSNTLRVAAHANAHHVQIQRIGSAKGYATNLAPSPLARLQAQSEWVLGAGLLAGLLAMASLIMNWWEIRKIVRLLKLNNKRKRTKQ